MISSRLSGIPARAVFLVTVILVSMALLVSCGAAAPPAPSETVPASTGAAPAPPSAAPLPGSEPFAGPDLEQSMVSGYEIFLQIDGVSGESVDASHKGWIDVLSYNHGILQPSGDAASGARIAAVAQHEAFTISKMLDKASPKLAVYCCKGQHVATVRVELCRATGDKQKFMEYLMEDVIIGSVTCAGSITTGEALPIEEVSFSYGKITWTYTEFDPATGKAKGTVSGYWDVVQNKGA